MLTLYFSPGSSAMAPHIALHEIGAPFDSVRVSFSKRDNRAPAYLALNPEGKVPTLLIDGRPLTEVAAILFYLAKRFPESGLWPEGDLEAEAQAISWMSFIAATIHPARRQGVQRCNEVFAIAEQRLGRGSGCWGGIRSPTFTCSGCTGGLSIRDIRRRARSPTSPHITSA